MNSLFKLAKFCNYNAIFRVGTSSMKKASCSLSQ
jgi:hypothetical protein